MICCGKEMECVGMRFVNGFAEDTYECVVCDRRTDRPESKFENGKLRADGMAGRYDQKHMPVDVMPAIKPNRVEREESHLMNQMITEIVSSHKRCVAGHQMKTREQRRAELSVILERYVD